MKRHEWRETTEEGLTRMVRVSQHGGKWQLQARLKSETEWTKFPVIPLEDLETLREILWNKYQRSRLPHDHVLQVEALIAAAKQRESAKHQNAANNSESSDGDPSRQTDQSKQSD